MTAQNRGILLLILSLPLQLFSQTYISEAPLREADVMWSMRVWRELDLRQKINQPLYYPLEKSQGYSSLYDVIMDGVRGGDITAYGTGPLGNVDEFTHPMSSEEIRGLIYSTDSVWTERLDGSGHELVVIHDSIRTEEIKRYRIKEDWIFDRNTSRMMVRIIAIAPLHEQFSEDGVSRGHSPLFWIDYREARSSLATATVFLRHNDNRALNYDDIFAKRFFDGYVVKASNVYDRSISSYRTGIDALLEGEAIEERIRNMESDLWTF